MKLETNALGELFEKLRRDQTVTQSDIGDAEREIGKIVDYIHSLERKLERIKEEIES